MLNKDVFEKCGFFYKKLEVSIFVQICPEAAGGRHSAFVILPSAILPLSYCLRAIPHSGHTGCLSVTLSLRHFPLGTFPLCEHPAFATSCLATFCLCTTLTDYPTSEMTEEEGDFIKTQNEACNAAPFFAEVWRNHAKKRSKNGILI